MQEIGEEEKYRILDDSTQILKQISKRYENHPCGNTMVVNVILHLCGSTIANLQVYDSDNKEKICNILLDKVEEMAEKHYDLLRWNFFNN